MGNVTEALFFSHLHAFLIFGKSLSFEVDCSEIDLRNNIPPTSPSVFIAVTCCESFLPGGFPSCAVTPPPGAADVAGPVEIRTRSNYLLQAGVTPFSLRAKGVRFRGRHKCFPPSAVFFCVRVKANEWPLPIRIFRKDETFPRLNPQHWHFISLNASTEQDTEIMSRIFIDIHFSFFFWFMHGVFVHQRGVRVSK